MSQRKGPIKWKKKFHFVVGAIMFLMDHANGVKTFTGRLWCLSKKTYNREDGWSQKFINHASKIILVSLSIVLDCLIVLCTTFAN